MKTHYFKCWDCLRPVAVRLDCVRPYVDYTCSCGGRLDYMGAVGPSGKRLKQHGYGCPCDSRCTHATGPKCDCQCGGKNHGTGRIVPFEADAGGVPRLTDTPDADAMAVASEWREAVQAIRDRVQSFGGGWLERAQFERKLRLEDAWRRARKLKTHKRRMAVIREALDGDGVRNA